MSLPAPGFRQTLPGGQAWKRFVDECIQSGQHTAYLPYPDEKALLPVLGFGREDGSALALLGGAPNEEAHTLRALMPLMAAAFRGERAEKTGEGHAAVARGIAQQAQSLAACLDGARREVEHALLAAREAEQRKDEFLAMLAHELRNPLSPMTSALAVLRTRTGDDAIVIRNVDILARQIQHMTRLIEDLLDVSRITRGKISLQLETIDLARVIEAAVESAQDLIRERHQTLKLDLPPGEILVDADFTRLTQVFTNLLNNAAKYTDPEGAIRIAAAREDNRAVVRVSDTGLGIPREMLDQVFQLFVQAHSTIDRTRGGLGIGLTLVKSLVAMHNGGVECRSEGAGQGSEFIIWLPLAAGAPEAVASGEPSEPVVVGPARRILMVDDNQDAAAALADLLELWGHTVTVAYDGEAALALASIILPEVVLLDIGLPGIDGYEVARQLRAPVDEKLPLLIAISGYGQESDLEKTRLAGFDHHLTKPVDPMRLRKLLDGFG